MDTTNLIAWLPFDESTTEDLCGNTWTAVNNPTISANGAISVNALQLTGNNYIQCNSVAAQIGDDIWTIHWHATCTGTQSEQFFFGTYNANYGTSGTGTNKWVSVCYLNGNPRLSLYSNDIEAGTSLVRGQRYHYALSYDGTNLRFFVDGQLKITKAANIKLGGNFRIGADPCRSDAYQYFTGSIDEFCILKGVAWTENFTPPTAEDYFEQRLALTGSANISLTFDVARRLSNRVEFSVDVARIVQKIWRYVNLGTADDLITSGTTLTNRTKAQSITGTAFYQTTRAKCFDLPATPEVWMKFDVYFDGSNRWRAFNGAGNSAAYNAGVTAQTDGSLSFVNLSAVQTGFAGICKKNTLQTVLLHMISGSSGGIVEAWVDGTKIYTYTGNVNKGEDFADIYLQSDGSGTYFSNVLISNARIGLNDGYKSFTADVVRRLKNRVQVTFDVERYLLKPIHVPLIGDHFNHCCSVEYDAPTTSIGRPLKIKLPNKSKAYVHATALNGGAFKVFSDTDAVGTVTGDVYAALDECESVFVQKVVAPQSILYMFLNSLRYRGGSALDSAIENCTYGVFPSKDELVNSFLNDLDNSESNLDFLSRCCGVDLSNDDTGAVIGSDAGGGYPKTAKSIVPEPVPVEDWIVPEKGSSKTIAGLTVYFPTSGYKGTLTDAENHILAGLNSVWIEQALLLIQRSCNIDFRTNQTNIVHDISVKFVDENNDALAYVSITTKDGSTTSLELRVNMRRYSSINMTSEDGAAGSNTYLDRVLAHEMTHAVMAARIKNYTELPRFLREGIAEFIHGIDDERKSDIQYLTQTAQRNTLQSIFSTGGDSGDINIYSAGYLFFRYMIKQTLEKGTFPLERYSSTGHIRLFISDGAVDYFGNALTDNTRQIFSADVARTLIKSLGLIVDVVIRDVIRVSFTADVARAISAKLILFPINNSLLRLKSTPQNTQGIQSLEVNIGEQQITEQINFAGIIPFDILQQVNGQYLDYHFSMRVEKVQQEGIIYRCECCSDLDKLLFTQLAYKIPPSTWRKVGADDTTVEIQTYYPPATAHVQKIASALGLTPVMQFDNFLSTVLMDDLGGVTYNDLIRDVFGWSSRVPHMLINCYIRDGKLYVIQRGHEAHTIDISDFKHTMPIITKELVRTTWGSTPWSKTQTTEFQHNSWQAGVPDDVTIGGGSSDTGGGSTLPSGDDQQEQFKEVSTQFSGHDYQGNTTYTYDRKGLLIQTYTHVEKDVDGRLQITNTTVSHGYDDDNTMIYTETFVQSYGAEGESSSRSIEEKGYVTLPNGEKFLAWEHAATYQNDEGLTPTDSDLVDSKVTVHSPSRVGQTHTMTINTDGEIIGSAAGQNTGDDRVTPFSKYNAAVLGKKLFSSNSNTISGGSSGGSSGEWTTDTETYELTTNGLSLYDSSFPIHNESKLIQVTQALRWLNRKTQETLTISVYEFPHLIDFNDRIIFNGNEYFLVNNTATTTPRIFNEQNLTLRRWY